MQGPVCFFERTNWPFLSSLKPVWAAVKHFYGEFLDRPLTFYCIRDHISPIKGTRRILVDRYSSASGVTITVAGSSVPWSGEPREFQHQVHDASLRNLIACLESRFDRRSSKNDSIRGTPRIPLQCLHIPAIPQNLPFFRNPKHHPALSFWLPAGGPTHGGHARSNRGMGLGFRV